jgi:hypothetical protein
VILVRNCLTVKGAEDVLNKQFAFELSTSKETMYFIADTDKVLCRPLLQLLSHFPHPPSCSSNFTWLCYEFATELHTNRVLHSNNACGHIQ